MELATLQSAMIAAMKAKDKPRKDAISALVSAVKKAGIDAGCREDIPTSMVQSGLILKELKSVKEQIDTCPDSRADLKEVISVSLQRDAGICTTADVCRRSKRSASGEARRSTGNEEQRND